MRWWRRREPTQVTNVYKFTPVTLGPRDRMVVGLPRDFSADRVAEFAEQLRRQLPGASVVVGGCEIVVIPGAGETEPES